MHKNFLNPLETSKQAIESIQRIIKKKTCDYV